ncbi:hypothetical protein CDFC105_30672 [Clostridioides difficile]|nr:hypothetical protein CDFC105_30672 [Clostridioides difficile]
MCSLFFFFKQKTAYEMLRSLVGSEMCIRDRNVARIESDGKKIQEDDATVSIFDRGDDYLLTKGCLLYTSDAADDSLRGDLCGRRAPDKKNSVHLRSRCLI